MAIFERTISLPLWIERAGLWGVSDSYPFSWYNSGQSDPSLSGGDSWGASGSDRVYRNGSHVDDKDYLHPRGSCTVFYEHARFRGDKLEVFAGEKIHNLRDVQRSYFSSFIAYLPSGLWVM